jgi:probable rRNA maturation factor
MIELISREIAKRFSLAENIEVSITLADDILMRQLNKEYRDQDESTDVLSFAFRENEMPSVPGLELLGEIVLSLEQVKKQASEQKYSFLEELALLVVHGYLHLLGYDHLVENEAREMRKIEKEILAVLPFMEFL